MPTLPKLKQYQILDTEAILYIQTICRLDNIPFRVLLLLLLLLRHAQGTPRYLGNEMSYRRSAGVKTTGFFRAFRIFDKKMVNRWW